MGALRRLLGCLLLAGLIGAVTTIPTSAVPEGPPSGSPDWYAREATNLQKTAEETQREDADPAFFARVQAQSQANLLAFNQRQVADPSWNTQGNVCQAWQQDCAGDPYLYPGVDTFYGSVGQVTPISYYDDGGARISGRVWAPAHPVAGKQYPGVVIETGSVQAPETLYWWFAETLVRNGYVAMTFDVRGQGNSDNHTPSGDQGSNANSSVFWNGLVDAVDWFRSTPAKLYTYNAKWLAGRVPAPTTPNNDYNPLYRMIDHTRLGIVGHSLGATGVSVVQGLDPWPGVVDHGAPNPVGVTVAWDNLLGPSGASGSGTPPFKIRTPSLGSSNDYSLVVQPYTSEPDPEGKKAAFHEWEKAGVPVMQVVIQGGTHYEYSRISQFPVPFPTTNWFTWGNPFADHYSLAWIDRWLKHPDEPGYGTADARLLQDSTWAARMSFYFRSARDFPDRSGTRHVCQDIRAGCKDTAAAFSPPAYVPSAASSSGLPGTFTQSGPLPVMALLAIAGALLLWRRRASASRHDLTRR